MSDGRADRTEIRDGLLLAGDPLRAVAALSVLLFHAAFLTIIARPRGDDYYGRFDELAGSLGGPLLANLNLGLYVFFVLSGYLIARPFVHAFVRGVPAPAFRRYARNRLLRIVPAYWVIFTVALLYHGSQGSSAREIGAVYLFAQVYDTSEVSQLVGPAWTLCVEMAFYALVPVAAWLAARAAGSRLGPRGRLAFVLAAAAAVFGASLLVRSAGLEHISSLRMPPAMLFAFMPGVALAALELVAPARLAGLRRAPSLALALVVAGLALLALLHVARHVDPTDTDVRALLAALGTGLIVAGPLALQWSRGRAWRALDNRLLHWVGERSYSMYLVHVPLQLAVLAQLPQDLGPRRMLLVFVVLNLTLAIALADLNYRLVERPFLRRRGRGRTVPAPAHMSQVEPTLARERVALAPESAG